MHRHGYKGRKLHRDTAQRTALLRGLAISLIEHGSIETTLPRAKELVPFIEPIITKAKKGDLASRRAVIAALDNRPAAYTLVDELVGQMGGRDSGHVRVKRTRLRVGDNAQMATISFVDTLERSDDAKPAAKPAKAAASTKPASKKPATSAKPARKTSAAKAPRKVTATDKHLSHKPAATVRKTGER